ncbi:MAG: hypothetical protein GTO14_09585 [Anaerolineales bacterium]|nr:hypothetical protein [Anaerolineales bacterium]
MTDLVEQLLSRIEAHRLPELELGPGAVHPVYGGLSILNLPASLSRWLGGPDLSHPPIDLPQLDTIADGVRQVVYVLIDAVSLRRFLIWFDGVVPTLDPNSESTILGALTSTVPSTTCTALTTLWTGRSPSEHGILGYELFLREYGLVANMITHSPMVFDGSAGLLYRAGFRPESALPVPTLGPQLKDAGITAHGFLANSIRHSGLSRMHYEGVNVHGFGAPSDLWIGVRELAGTPIERRRLIWVYYGGVDGLSHRFGPDSEQARAEFTTFLRAMNDHFISSTLGASKEQTLLLIISDHGQISTPLDPQYEVRNHPALARRLHILPTGENRLSFLYPQPGQVEAVREYFEDTWPKKFSLFPSETLLKAGLFGPGIPAGATPGRLGDLAAVSHEDAYLWWAFKENPLIGRHGGLSPDEMLVPLLAARLD